MDVRINEARMALPYAMETWGELLEWIERRHLEPGHCIRRVLFAGVEELNYRQPATCGRTLEVGSAIHIESADFDSVVRESLGELDEGLRGAIDAAFQISQLLGNEQDAAYSALDHLVDTIHVFFSVFSTDLGWVDLAERGRESDALLEGVEDALIRLQKARDTRDGATVSTILEHEIVPALEGWQLLAGRTHAQICN